VSIEDVKQIDLVGIDRESGDVELTVSDHLDWRNSQAHQLALQSKLNTYLAFIESGEIYEKYPKAQGRRLVITVAGKYEPDSGGKNFLEKVKSAVEGAGFGFKYELFSVNPDHPF
jgi:hypothetical protein